MRSATPLEQARVCREMLEALEAYGHARQAWAAARQVFERTGQREAAYVGAGEAWTDWLTAAVRL